MHTFCVYNSRTGRFAIIVDGMPIQISQGYSGTGAGRDNHLLEDMKGVGPIPRGLYTLGASEKHPRLGPLAVPLKPHSKNEMFGRSGFMVHGDNKWNDASRGCIIVPRTTRAKLSEGMVLAVI